MAPVSIAAMASRVALRPAVSGLVRSAAMPVRVIVNTVVVRSGTASLRRRRSAGHRGRQERREPVSDGFAERGSGGDRKHEGSDQQPRFDNNRVAQQDPAPPFGGDDRASANECSEQKAAQGGKRRAEREPWGTADCEADEHDVAVMLATKTLPSVRMLTASTTPVSTVSASNSKGNGPCRSSAMSARQADALRGSVVVALSERRATASIIVQRGCLYDQRPIR